MNAVIKCSQIATPAGSVERAGDAMSELEIVDGAGIAVSSGKIAGTGRFGSVRRKYAGRVIDMEGMVAVPAFVDCHSHAVFSGDRAAELSMKLKGMTYGQILASGGGIQKTVRETRACSSGRLASIASERLGRLQRSGYCAFEIKSGYALETEGELRMLRAIRQLSRTYNVKATYLGAHAFPEGKGREEYVNDIVHRQLPEVSRSHLAEYCDVFVEAFAFSPEDAKQILSAASRLGMETTAHVDEFSDTGAVEVLAPLGLNSVSHLAFTGRSDFALLAREGIMGIILPSTPLFSFAERYPDARGMVSEGMAVAIGSDLSPNSYNMSPMLPVLLSIYRCGLKQEEALTAATLNAACAIGLGDRVGSVEKGKEADILFLPYDDFSHFMYQYTEGASVMKGGKLI